MSSTASFKGDRERGGTVHEGAGGVPGVPGEGVLQPEGRCAGCWSPASSRKAPWLPQPGSLSLFKKQEQGWAVCQPHVVPLGSLLGQEHKQTSSRRLPAGAPPCSLEVGGIIPAIPITGEELGSRGLLSHSWGRRPCPAHHGTLKGRGGDRGHCESWWHMAHQSHLACTETSTHTPTRGVSVCLKVTGALSGNCYAHSPP